MQYHQPYGISDPNAPYINGDPSIGRAGSIPPAASIEYPQREIVAAINAAGLTPSDADLAQLWKAMQRNPWLTHAAVDSGTANAMVVALSIPTPNLYFGMEIRVKPAFNNTGPATINVDGHGAYPVIRASGGALSSGDYVAGEVLTLAFDGSSWQIENFLGQPATSTTINNINVKIPYSVAGGTANALTGTFTPTITTRVPGDPVLVKVGLKNTGAATLQVDALAAVPLVWPDLTPLIYGDLRVGAVMLCIFDGTNYQITSIVGPYFGHGFSGNVAGLSVPDSTWTRVAPATANYKNTLDQSTFVDGVFTCGAGESGWWIATMDAGYTPGVVHEGSAWVARITGGTGGYFSQNNVNDAGNQGNSACVSCVLYLSVGQQIIFDVFHLGGGGAFGANFHGMRVGR